MAKVTGFYGCAGRATLMFRFTETQSEMFRWGGFQMLNCVIGSAKLITPLTRSGKAKKGASSNAARMLINGLLTR